MAIVQKGTLGKTGPVFVDDSSVPGKLVFLQGTLLGGAVRLVAKQPAYAKSVLGGNESDYSLGNYTDNKVLDAAPAHKMPATGNVFDGYVAIGNDWITGTTAGLEDHSKDFGYTGGSSSSSSGSSTGGSSSTGGTSVSTGGGSSTGGTTTDTTYKAPTFMEQFQTFMSSYWWLVLIILAVVLYKPVIAPALGLGKKPRKYR